LKRIKGFLPSLQWGRPRGSLLGDLRITLSFARDQGWIIPSHSHEPPERHGADGVGCFSKLEAGEHSTETKGELKHPYPKKLGDEKVSKLVNENEDAENDDR
jgi:hypothetical protein